MIKRWIPILCVFATAMLADTLTLRDGKTVQGDYAGGDPRTIRLMVGDSVQSFRVSDIVSLTFGPGPGGPAAAAVAPPPPSAPPQIPAGTEIRVRMIDPVASRLVTPP
jgi:hypothetical protein